MSATLINFFLLPIGLGLLGFIEPCSMGANLLFIKHLERRSPRAKLLAGLIFTLTRGLFIGLLGVVAAGIGSGFIELQKGFWLVLGTLYLLLGVIYLMGRSGALMQRVGPSLSRISTVRGTMGLGILFGLNIPACAAPLLFALFGSAVGAATLTQGFITLALFGLALSIPLLLAVMVPSLGARLDRLAALTQRMPFWTGMVFVALGLWSIYFAFVVDLEAWS